MLLWTDSDTKLRLSLQSSDWIKSAPPPQKYKQTSRMIKTVLKTMCSIYSNMVGSGNNRMTMAVEYRPPIKLKEVRPESILFLWCSPNGSHKKNLIVPNNISAPTYLLFSIFARGILCTLSSLLCSSSFLLFSHDIGITGGRSKCKG